eukprot:12434878-Prorocentrum_lima.AAC.1
MRRHPRANRVARGTCSPGVASQPEVNCQVKWQAPAACGARCQIKWQAPAACGARCWGTSPEAS